MPNLDDIHYKFFPKSKTAPMGKKLIYFAWGIEILVALVGLTIAWLFFTSKGQTGVSAETLGDEFNVDSYVVSLAFIVVAVMELTKIPLATACYYAGKWTWRTIFIIALLAVNYSTFETIIQGFELRYHNMLAIVDVELEKKQKLEKEINDLINNNDNKTIENNKLINELNELEKKKTQIETNKIDNINNIQKQHSASNNDVINKLEDNREKKIIEVKEKENSILPLENKIIEIEKNKSSCNEKGWKKERDACKAAKQKIIDDTQDRIDQISLKINKLDGEIAEIGVKITDLASRLEGDINPLITAEEKKASKEIERIQLLIDQKVSELEKIENKTSSANYLERIELLKEQLIEQDEKLAKTARQNQIYRIAKFIKNSSASISAWWNNETAKEYKLTEIDQGDTDLAFLLWFGGLALVISIIGTLVALAGLHLQDERMHEIRNRPIKVRFGRFFRNIAWIPVYINKYIWSGIKKLVKPKIIEKEVEVEKIVEKVVEKNVGEKIVYEKVEVPKEVIKKEMVYVPLPTDDEELLKKGPFTKDENKKKK